MQRLEDKFDFDDLENESVSNADLDYLAGAYRDEVHLTKRILTLSNQTKPNLTKPKLT